MEGIDFPPYLIEKIFPPKECINLVDTNNDGLSDSIQIQAINWVLPFTIPETIDLGDFNLETTDLSSMIQIVIDSEPLEIYDMKYLRENARFFFKGNNFTFNSILDGTLAGQTVAVGDKLTILLKLKEADTKKLEESKGKHEIIINIKSLPTLTIKYELFEKNMNIKFDPSKT